MRLFVQDYVYDEVVDELADRLDTREFGHNTERHDLRAPTSSEAQLNVYLYQVRRQLPDRLLAGDELLVKSGNCYPLTLVEQVADDPPISSDEVLGPVITAYWFKDETEVVRPGE